MRIAVMGAGGVGGYFGGRLAQAGNEVAFIARGRHLEGLRTKGLVIESSLGNATIKVRAVERAEEAGTVDVVLFTVKLYDADAAAATLTPLIGPDTVVITLQNGVEAVDMVAKHVGKDHVAGAAAYIVIVIDKPGHLRHTAAHQLVFGEPDGTRSPRLVAFEEACTRAGFHAKTSTGIETDLWVKFVRLSTWSGMTAVTRCPMGVIRDDKDLFAMMMTAIDEAIAVGRARGVRFPENLVDETLKLIHRFPAESKSSMFEDLERGRPLELPWLSGAVVRLGREVGVPAPTHQFITTVLSPFVNGAR